MIATDKPTVLEALQASNGNMLDAAKALKMSYRTIYRKVDELNLHRDLEKIRAKAPPICPACRRPL